MTLSDTAAIVFGAALALALHWDNPVGAVGLPEPRWVLLGSFTQECVEKASLALIPLAFWRRVRLGGALGSAELLLVVCASPMVVRELDWAVWDAQGKNGVDYNGDLGDAFWWFRAVAWSTALSAVLGLALGRRWLGDLTRSALLIVAVAASYPWLPDALLNVQEVTVGAYQLDAPAEAAVAVVCGTLRFLIAAIIGVAAVRVVFSRGGQTSIMAMAGLTLAAADLIISSVLSLWDVVPDTFAPDGAWPLVMRLGGPLAATLIACIVIWATGGPSAETSVSSAPQTRT